MPILITKGTSVPNQPGKVYVRFYCPLSTETITEGTLFCTVRQTIFFWEWLPIIVPLGEDNRDHETGL